MVSADIGRKAVDAAKRYAKVGGHAADLNFADCFAYACARAYSVPLLYKGNDFTQTGLAWLDPRRDASTLHAALLLLPHSTERPAPSFQAGF